MAKIRNKINLATLKYQAVKLRGNYQIPLGLYVLISQLDSNSSEKQVKFLLYASEQLLRVRGFYKKYHDQDKQLSEQVKSEFTKL